MTYLELKNSVKAYLNRTDLDSYVGDFINFALLKVEQFGNYSSMLYETSGDLLEGQQYIESPERMKAVKLLRVLDLNHSEDRGKTLTPTSFEVFVNLSRVVRKGEPSIFYVAKDKIYIFNTPEADNRYKYILNYYKFSPSFVNDNDSNWLSENHPHILIYGGLIEAESFLINDDRIVTWKLMYDDAIRKLELAEVEKVRPRKWIIRNGVNV